MSPGFLLYKSGNGGHIIFQMLPFLFTRPTGLDVHLLQIYVYLCKANHSTDITQHTQKLFFFDFA